MRGLPSQVAPTLEGFAPTKGGTITAMAAEIAAPGRLKREEVLVAAGTRERTCSTR